jgi:hypothetical protein
MLSKEQDESNVAAVFFRSFQTAIVNSMRLRNFMYRNFDSEQV